MTWLIWRVRTGRLYISMTAQHSVIKCKRCAANFKERYSHPSEITYAAKAYFSLGMARQLATLGVGVDVVSLGELAVARRAGFSPEKVHLHGNNKSAEELSAALEWGVQSIVIDNLEELHLLEMLASQHQKVARVWLRISPGVVVDTHAYLQTSHLTSKFGLPLAGDQAAQAILAAQNSPWLHLTGLHTHLGSNFFEAEPYQRAIASLLSLAEETGFVPEEISPGGGWGVPYLAEQSENKPDRWIETVTGAICEEYNRHTWPLPTLVIEPGRWLVARAGVALYTVGVTKTAGDGTRFVAVDGGMADNLRPALYQSRYTALLPLHPDDPPTQTVNVVGKFCKSGDQLITDVLLPETHRGDLLLMPVAGAYQLSMASNYNLAPRPAVLWLESEGLTVLQQRELPEMSGWWMGE